MYRISQILKISIIMCLIISTRSQEDSGEATETDTPIPHKTCEDHKPLQTYSKSQIRLRTKSEQKCISVDETSTILAPCDVESEQFWNLEKPDWVEGKRWFRLVSNTTQECLQDKDSNSPSLTECKTHEKTQLWSVLGKAGAGPLAFMSYDTCRCLYMNEEGLELGDCAEADEQLWYIERIRRVPCTTNPPGPTRSTRRTTTKPTKATRSTTKKPSGSTRSTRRSTRRSTTIKPSETTRSTRRSTRSTRSTTTKPSELTRSTRRSTQKTRSTTTKPTVSTRSTRRSTRRSTTTKPSATTRSTRRSTRRSTTIKPSELTTRSARSTRRSTRSTRKPKLKES